MTVRTADARGWFRPLALSAAVLPAGWLGFSVRTWLALCLGLATAFWCQISSPAGTAVTVMILAQPLRGQALSKAAYRLVGTFAGVVVSIILVSCFSQDRPIFLGGVALWLAFCTLVGSLERDFRAYGALLAGYTVTLVAVNSIDRPGSVFDAAMSRASGIGIGVAATTVVALLTGTPEVWRKLIDEMDGLAGRIATIGRTGLEEGAVPDPMEMISLSAAVLALLGRMSHARTEMEHARIRLRGARCGIVGMLTVLSAARGLADLRSRTGIADIVLRHTQRHHAGPHEYAERDVVLQRLLDDILAEDPTFQPTPMDALYLERAAILIASRRRIAAGMETLRHATPLRDVPPTGPLWRRPDWAGAFVNAGRTLIGFTLFAGIWIALGQPAAETALAQAALALCLAAMMADTVPFGVGAMVGTACACMLAVVLHFFVLPHVQDMVTLSFVLLPSTVVFCILLLIPRFSAIGFFFGVFLPVILGLGNHNDYDPDVMTNRIVFYLLAGCLSFIALALLFPTNHRHIRLRAAVDIGHDLLLEFRGRGPGPAAERLSLKYDRLGHALAATRKRPVQGLASARVFGRLVAFEDIASAIARAGQDLDRAAAIPALAAHAAPARAALAHAPAPGVADALARHAAALLTEPPRDAVQASGNHLRAVLASAGAQAVSDFLATHADALRRYGLAGARTR